MFDFGFLLRLFFDFSEEKYGWKKNCFMLSEIEKVNDDGDRHQTESPKHAGVQELHSGKDTKGYCGLNDLTITHF
jgi:hypothetical protein